MIVHSLEEPLPVMPKLLKQTIVNAEKFNVYALIDDPSLLPMVFAV